MPRITAAQFRDRFITMVLRGHGLPKQPADRHILWYSATFGLEPQRSYTEHELNELLRRWTTRFGDGVGLDHVTLRRYLIDARYISRDAAGTVYRLDGADLPYRFDPAIAGLDLDELIHEAIQEREERKRRYLNAKTSEG